MGFVIMAINFEHVPVVAALIFKSAFGMQAGFGAVLGLAIEWGVKRGVYSNEAGQGTAPHAAAAAEVAHPAKQGYVQAFSVYIDTMLVCSVTAFLILSTGMYNVINPAGGMLVDNLPGMEIGPGYAQAAVESIFPGFGQGFVALALLFFAFTTIVAYYYMAETNIAYINRRVHRRWLTPALRLGILAMVAVGTGPPPACPDRRREAFSGMYFAPPCLAAASRRGCLPAGHPVAFRGSPVRAGLCLNPPSGDGTSALPPRG
jgi:AGCS family alanine or glycine:cation symporter